MSRNQQDRVIDDPAEIRQAIAMGEVVNADRICPTCHIRVIVNRKNRHCRECYEIAKNQR